MNLTIINFENRYANDFYHLNIEWLQTYFYVEPYDEEVLSKPQTYIIDKESSNISGEIWSTMEQNNVVL